MRLSFPNGELADVLAPPGEVTIGCAAGNTVVLTAEGVRPHHATILTDARGITLLADDPEATIHVNARPVRERALLRLGDLLSLNSTNILLKPDDDAAVRTPPASVFEEGAKATGEAMTKGGPPRVVLRGVAGPLFGRAVSITERLVIGSAGESDLRLEEANLPARHAEIRVLPGVGIFLRDLGSGAGTTINGVQVKDAVLFSGDQIAFQQNRFVLEAPGMPTRKDLPTTDAPVVSKALPPDPRPPVAGVTQTLRAIRPEDLAASANAKQTPSSTKKTAELPQLPSSQKDPNSPWLLVAIGMMIAIGIALLLMARGGV